MHNSVERSTDCQTDKLQLRKMRSNTKTDSDGSDSQCDGSQGYGSHASSPTNPNTQSDQVLVNTSEDSSAETDVSSGLNSSLEPPPADNNGFGWNLVTKRRSKRLMKRDYKPFSSVDSLLDAPAGSQTKVAKASTMSSKRSVRLHAYPVSLQHYVTWENPTAEKALELFAENNVPSQTADVARKHFDAIKGKRSTRQTIDGNMVGRHLWIADVSHEIYRSASIEADLGGNKFGIVLSNSCEPSKGVTCELCPALPVRYSIILPDSPEECSMPFLWLVRSAPKISNSIKEMSKVLKEVLTLYKGCQSKNLERHSLPIKGADAANKAIRTTLFDTSESEDSSDQDDDSQEWPKRPDWPIEMQSMIKVDKLVDFCSTMRLNLIKALKVKQGLLSDQITLAQWQNYKSSIRKSMDFTENGETLSLILTILDQDNPGSTIYPKVVKIAKTFWSKNQAEIVANFEACKKLSSDLSFIPSENTIARLEPVTADQGSSFHYPTLPSNSGSQSSVVEGSVPQSDPPVRHQISPAESNVNSTQSSHASQNVTVLDQQNSTGLANIVQNNGGGPRPTVPQPGVPAQPGAPQHGSCLNQARRFLDVSTDPLFEPLPTPPAQLPFNPTAPLSSAMDMSPGFSSILSFLAKQSEQQTMVNNAMINAINGLTQQYETSRSVTAETDIDSVSLKSTPVSAASAELHWDSSHEPSLTRNKSPSPDIISHNDFTEADVERAKVAHDNEQLAIQQSLLDQAELARINREMELLQARRDQLANKSSDKQSAGTVETLGRAEDLRSERVVETEREAERPGRPAEREARQEHRKDREHQNGNDKTHKKRDKSSSKRRKRRGREGNPSDPSDGSSSSSSDGEDDRGRRRRDRDPRKPRKKKNRSRSRSRSDSRVRRELSDRDKAKIADLEAALHVLWDSRPEIHVTSGGSGTAKSDDPLSVKLLTVGDTDFRNQHVMLHINSEVKLNMKIAQIVWKGMSNKKADYIIKQMSCVSKAVIQSINELTRIGLNVQYLRDNIPSWSNSEIGMARKRFENLLKDKTQVSKLVAEIQSAHCDLERAILSTSDLEEGTTMWEKIIPLLDNLGQKTIGAAEYSLIFICNDILQCIENTGQAIRMVLLDNNISEIPTDQMSKDSIAKKYKTERYKFSGDGKNKSINVFGWISAVTKDLKDLGIARPNQPGIILDWMMNPAKAQFESNAYDFKDGQSLLKEVENMYGDIQTIIKNKTEVHRQIGSIPTQSTLRNIHQYSEADSLSFIEAKVIQHWNQMDEVARLLTDRKKLALEEFEEKHSRKPVTASEVELVERRTDIPFDENYLKTLFSVIKDIAPDLGLARPNLPVKHKLSSETLFKEYKDTLGTLKDLLRLESRSTPAAQVESLPCRAFLTQPNNAVAGSSPEPPPTKTVSDNRSKKKGKEKPEIDDVSDQSTWLQHLTLITNRLNKLDETMSGFTKPVAANSKEKGAKGKDKKFFCTGCYNLNPNGTHYHKDMEESRSCTYLKQFFESPGMPWKKACDICILSAKAANSKQNNDAIHYQIKGSILRDTCQLLEDCKLEDRFEGMSQLGVCTSCLRKPDMHRNKNNPHQPATNTCNPKYDVCNFTGCTRHFAICDKHADYNREAWNLRNTRMNELTKSRSSLPVHTRQSLRTESGGHTCQNKSSRFEATQIIEDFEAIPTVLQFKDLDGNLVNILFDTGSSPNICDKETSHNFEVTRPVKPVQSMIYGFSNIGMKTDQEVYDIKLQNNPKVKRISVQTVDNINISLSNPDLSHHLALLQIEAKLMEKDLDHIKQTDLSNHNGKINMIVGNGCTSLHPSCIFQSALDICVYENKISLFGRNPQYCLGGRIPKLTEYADLIASLIQNKLSENYTDLPKLTSLVNRTFSVFQTGLEPLNPEIKISIKDMLNPGSTDLNPNLSVPKGRDSTDRVSNSGLENFRILTKKVIEKNRSQAAGLVKNRNSRSFHSAKMIENKARNQPGPDLCTTIALPTFSTGTRRDCSNGPANKRKSQKVRIKLNAAQPEQLTSCLSTQTGRTKESRPARSNKVSEVIPSPHPILARDSSPPIVSVAIPSCGNCGKRFLAGEFDPKIKTHRCLRCPHCDKDCKGPKTLSAHMETCKSSMAKDSKTKTNSMVLVMFQGCPNELSEKYNKGNNHPFLVYDSIKTELNYDSDFAPPADDHRDPALEGVISMEFSLKPPDASDELQEANISNNSHSSGDKPVGERITLTYDPKLASPGSIESNDHYKYPYLYSSCPPTKRWSSEKRLSQARRIHYRLFDYKSEPKLDHRFGLKYYGESLQHIGVTKWINSLLYYDQDVLRLEDRVIILLSRNLTRSHKQRREMATFVVIKTLNRYLLKEWWSHIENVAANTNLSDEVLIKTAVQCIHVSIRPVLHLLQFCHTSFDLFMADLEQAFITWERLTHGKPTWGKLLVTGEGNFPYTPPLTGNDVRGILSESASETRDGGSRAGAFTAFYINKNILSIPICLIPETTVFKLWWKNITFMFDQLGIEEVDRYELTFESLGERFEFRLARMENKHTWESHYEFMNNINMNLYMWPGRQGCLGPSTTTGRFESRILTMLNPNSSHLFKYKNWRDYLRRKGPDGPLHPDNGLIAPELHICPSSRNTASETNKSDGKQNKFDHTARSKRLRRNVAALQAERHWRDQTTIPEMFQSIFDDPIDDTKVVEKAKPDSPGSGRRPNCVSISWIFTLLAWLLVWSLGSAHTGLVMAERDLVWTTWPHRASEGQDLRVALDQIVAYDATGEFTAAPPKHSTVSLLHAQKCRPLDHELEEPKPIKVQVVYRSPSIEVEVYQCRVTISHTQQWCGYNGIAYDIEGTSTVLTPRVVDISKEGCRTLYETGELTFTLYNSTKSIHPQVDSAIMMSNVPRGWHVTETEVAGRTFADDSCEGARFDYMDKTYLRNVLKRHVVTEITVHKGKYFSDTDTVYLRNLADLPAGGRSSFDTIHGNLVVNKPIRADECHRITELFINRGTIHLRRKTKTKVGAIVFVENKENRKTAFVVTNSSQLCGSNVLYTTIDNVILTPITEKNRPLKTVPPFEGNVDLLVENKHEFVAGQATIETDFDKAVVAFEEQNCINSLNSQINTLLIMAAASPAALVNLFHGITARRIGSAVSITQANPVLAWIRDFRPSQGEPGVCCMELPISILHNNTKTDLFVHSVSRVITKRCSPTHCGQGFPIMHAHPSSQAVRAAIESEVTPPWTSIHSFDSPGDQGHFLCDIGQGLNQCKHPTELKPMDTTKTRYAGLGAIEDSFMATLWNSSTEQVSYRIHEAQSDNIAGAAESEGMATGLTISTPVTNRYIQNLPPEVIHKAWGSAFATFIPGLSEWGELLSQLIPAVVSIILASGLGIFTWCMIGTCANCRRLAQALVDFPRLFLDKLKRLRNQLRARSAFQSEDQNTINVDEIDLPATVSTNRARITELFGETAHNADEIRGIRATLGELSHQMFLIEDLCRNIQAIQPQNN